MQAVISRGRHARRHRGIRWSWISGFASAAVAAIVALVLAFGQTAPDTAVQHERVPELAHLTSAQRAAVNHAIVTAFREHGEAGIGNMPRPGSVRLDAAEWSWGTTGSHVAIQPGVMAVRWRAGAMVRL
jgi:hypothetical protein